MPKNFHPPRRDPDLHTPKPKKTPAKPETTTTKKPSWNKFGDK